MTQPEGRSEVRVKAAHFYRDVPAAVQQYTRNPSHFVALTVPLFAHHLCPPVHPPPNHTFTHSSAQFLPQHPTIFTLAHAHLHPGESLRDGVQLEGHTRHLMGGQTTMAKHIDEGVSPVHAGTGMYMQLW